MNTEHSCLPHLITGIPETLSGTSAVMPSRDRNGEDGISPAGKIAEATSHLRVALLQIEDEIVKQHVSEALRILEEV